jgi:hypothetical protein
MKVQLVGKEYVSNLESLRFEPCFHTFFNQLSAIDGGGGPTWLNIFIL